MSETCLHGVDLRGECRECDQLVWLRDEVSRLATQRDALAVKVFEVNGWYDEAKNRVAELEHVIARAAGIARESGCCAGSELGCGACKRIWSLLEGAPSPPGQKTGNKE